MIAASAALLFSLACQSAQAQVTHVKCDVRADRSSASVKGARLPAGDYTAWLQSGGVSVQSAPLPTARGEVEFDFSSRPKDVAKGATEIGAAFIVNNTVTAYVMDSQGEVVATADRTCRVR
jgi:hypothetical protein